MGTLIEFPRFPKHDWSLMDHINLQQSVEKALAEATEFHRLANELPLKVRNKVLARTQAQPPDPLYAPWGGLFPHPRVKKEGW
jgi:hypothetical protein